MKIKTTAIAIIIFVSIFGFIAITSALGLWTTVNTKEPARYTSGEFTGEYNPEDIRGSYTFGEISELFEIPLEYLGSGFSIADENSFADFKCKELETIYASSSAEGKEVGTDSVRIFIALYKSLPITLNDNTYFPESALNVLKNNAKLTEEQITYLETHTVIPVDTTNIEKTSTETKEEALENSDTEKVIKGNTTFKELLDWGVKEEDIEKIINDKIPNTSETIKDYTLAKGIEFSTIKEFLQTLIEQSNE